MYYYFFLFFFSHSLIPGKRISTNNNVSTGTRLRIARISTNVRSTHGHTTGCTTIALRWHLILRQHSVICATLSSNFSRNPNHRTPPRQAPVTKRENYRARINTNYQDLHRETGLKMLKCRNRESNETVSRSGWYVLIIERDRGWPMNKSDIIARPT